MSNVPMSLEYSTDALFEFLEYMAEKGLANKNTVSSRKGACSKMFEILDSGEMSDVRGVDVDELATRFNNLRGTKYSPQSLQVYKSRVSKALEDFLRFKENPANFKPAIGSAAAKSSPKKKLRLKRPQVQETSSQGLEFAAGSSPSSHQFAGGSTINIPVALRPDVIIQINGLPVDLSKTEAEKVSAVVRAMVSVYED